MPGRKEKDFVQTPLYGLVLAGGKSTRMGRDKGLLSYHGLSQREHVYQLLKPVCDKVFISVGKGMAEGLDKAYSYIEDFNEFRGPFNGILSANTRYPEVAWLVVACDLPFIDRETIEFLADSRNPVVSATAYATKVSGLPEPLAAIWEPSVLKNAKAYLKTSESSCPRKYLLGQELQLIYPEDDQVLMNANSSEEYEQVIRKLQGDA